MNNDSWDDLPARRVPNSMYELNQMYPPSNRSRNDRSSGHRSTRNDNRRGQSRYTGQSSHRQQMDDKYRDLFRKMNVVGLNESRNDRGRNILYAKDENLPSEETFRKESQILLNRVLRDQKNRAKKKKIEIINNSTDDFVIQTKFPSVLNVKKDEEKEKKVFKSTEKINKLLEMDVVRWSDDRSNSCMMSTDTRVILNALQASSKLSNKDGYSICLSFGDYPPSYRERTQNELLKRIFIDGCAVTKQVDHEFDVSWKCSIGAKETFKQHKVLLVHPLILVAIRFILLGHKTTILLPSYYRNPIFANVRQKVDDVYGFHKLVSSGIVQFIDEGHNNEWWKSMLHENEKYDGSFVSSSDLMRMIKANIRWKEEKKKRDKCRGMNMNVDVNLLNINDNEDDIKIKKNDEELVKTAKHILTPYFISNHSKLIMPLHMSTVDKKIVELNEILFYEGEDTPSSLPLELQLDSQLELKEQERILLILQDLIELPMQEMRGMMMFRRMIKAIEQSNRERYQIEEETRLREFVNETTQAFSMHDDITDID